MDAVEKAIPVAQRSQWLEALGSMRSPKRSVLEWLQGEPGKPSRQTLAGQLAYVDFLKELAVHRYPLEMVRLEHQKQLAQRIRCRRPARWQTLREPRRTLEAVCFLRVTLLQKTGVLIALIDREILRFRRQAVEKMRKANTAGKLKAEPTSPQVEPVRDALFAEVGPVQLPEMIMEVDSHTRFSSALLGREPMSWQGLTLYGALLAHGTDMSAAAVSLMIPQISTAVSVSTRTSSTNGP